MSTTNRANSTQVSDPKSISDHLGELRRRLTWVVLMLIVMSALAYTVHDALVSLVLSPIGDQRLVYLTPGGGFTFIFQIVLYAGMLLSAPVMIYHAYRFIAPALPSSVRQRGLRVVILSTLLMVAGASFGYFVAVPAALQFLTAFAGDFVQANLTADSYLNFLVAYVLGLGVLFQLPLFLIAWNWMNPIQPGGLLSSQRFVIVGAFIAAAILTPTPDVFNQCLLALPIILVYQLGVVSVYVMNRQHRRTPGAAAPTQHPKRFDEPVFDVANLLGGDAKPVVRVAQPREQHMTHPVKMPIKSPSQQPRSSMDGFRRTTTAPVAPRATLSRRDVSLRPVLTRSTQNRVPVAMVRRHVSIDGVTVLQ